MNPFGVNKPTRIDQAELAIYNAGVMFSRLAYETEHRSSTEGINYAKRIAASEASKRSVARKKEQQS